MKSHFQNPLHDLCMKFKKEDEEQRLADEKKNVMACTKVVTNAIYCLKYSKSSTDFVCLNDKGNLTSICATINDGPQQFFYYREEIYDKFPGIVKAAFAQVKSAAFTLDKVTVELTPYTVLVTFFFHQGEINVFLNHLHVMKSMEYGEGTANFVGMELMRTLGIKRHQVGEIFHHAVYDGVYATPEERAHGGGCLSLTDHLADWCDVDSDHWKLGHGTQAATRVR